MAFILCNNIAFVSYTVSCLVKKFKKGIPQ